jgi:DNA (cytosine-5)-methyltransferase 1
MRVGALCAGYGGLELGLQQAGIDVELCWYSEIDLHACEVMGLRYPSVANLGDLTEISDTPVVDVVTAGFPCQPVSKAGKQKGVNDERWLIEDVCEVASRACAKFVVLENVPNLLTANSGDAMARTISALASNGFSAEWGCVRASDVGAPHQRLRWFCVAKPEQAGRVASDPVGEGPQRRSPLRRGGKFDFGESGVDFARWGVYAEAVARWELITGRQAPDPTDSKCRLNPRFSEWMMGLPEGWVTDAVQGRSHQLRILGNGVVPQQAAYAFNLLNGENNEL